ncbi:TerB family tellurite resistance protein [Bradyrhizobium sp.]|uniref:TerB family tellurite resistance protein n=2 Tax=Bradyrhizobium sp. TaxID=376 RepID=UPI003BAF587D
MPSDVRLPREKAVMPPEGPRSCRRRPHRPADQKIAQMMFRSLKTFFSTLIEHDRQAPAVSKLQLATAALLTRVATVHNEMSQARRAKLHAVLRSNFDLGDLATASLLQESVAVDRTAVDFYHFSRQLNQLLNDESRRRLVRMMWEVVYADGRVNELEDNIIWRVADLLGVTTRQRVELRQQIAPERAVLPAGLAGRHSYQGAAPVATKSS